jgi:hypothetical protein
VPKEGTKNKNDANGDYKKMNNNFLYFFFFQKHTKRKHNALFIDIVLDFQE